MIEFTIVYLEKLNTFANFYQPEFPISKIINCSTFKLIDWRRIALRRI